MRARGVFDTNVVLSALVFGARLAWLRQAWASGQVVPVVSAQTVAELRRVLAYPKFKLDLQDHARLLHEYLPYADTIVLPDPAPALPVACRDRDDVVFLQLASAANVALISGDRDVGVLRGLLPFPVMTAAEFWQSLEA